MIGQPGRRVSRAVCALAAGSPTTGRMQPPTEPRSATRFRSDEEDLYRRHHHELRRTVARAVYASPELIEDACQNAWAILLRRQPRRSTLFAWLRVVAIHEAYRLSAAELRDLHLEDLSHGEGWDALLAGRANLEEVVEAHEALHALAHLPERQREDLVLRVAGFSYQEIADMTGRRTYTNVNKQLAKARARLRLAQPHLAEGTTSIRQASS
jgi:RNA polymerase sigma factor (sigma-70 family)